VRSEQGAMENHYAQATPGHGHLDAQLSQRWWQLRSIDGSVGEVSLGFEME